MVAQPQKLNVGVGDLDATMRGGENLVPRVTHDDLLDIRRGPIDL